MAKTIFLDKMPENSPMLAVFDKNGNIRSEKLNILTTIGRAEKGVDIRIDSPIVSRVHGEIALVGNEYYYKDMDSTNGTYVNSTLVGVNSPDGVKSVKLKDSDKIIFDIFENGESHSDCADYRQNALCNADNKQYNNCNVHKYTESIAHPAFDAFKHAFSPSF